MTKVDVEGTHLLLQKTSSKYHLSPILSLQEVEHWLLPRENVIDTYVVEVWLHSLNISSPNITYDPAVVTIRFPPPLSTHRMMTALWRMWWVSIASLPRCWITQPTLIWEQLISFTSPPLPQTWLTSWRTQWSSLNLWVIHLFWIYSPPWLSQPT